MLTRLLQPMLSSLWGVMVTAAVTFNAGPIASSTTSVVVDPNVVVADGASVATITMLARDSLGNPVQNANLTLAGSGGNNTFAATSGQTDANGRFVTTLRSTQVQSETITATFVASGLTATAGVQFVPGQAYAATSSVIVTPTTQVANNANAVTATLILKDAQAHPISGQGTVFAATGAATNIAGGAATNSNGQSVATFTTSVAQQQNIQVSAGGLSWVQSVRFVAGPASSSYSNITINPNTQPADGSGVVGVTATFADQFNNPLSNTKIRFMASGQAGPFNPAQGLTNSVGLATTALTSRYAGVDTVAASPLGNGNFQVTGQAVFTARTSSCTGSTFYSEPPLISMGQNYAKQVITGDFDNDGRMDVATANQYGTTYISYGAGNGAFTTVAAFTSNTPWGLAASDLNGDGYSDFIVKSLNSGYLTVAVSTGARSYATSSPYYPGPGYGIPALVDLNGDGNKDMLMPAPNGAQIWVYPGRGNGLFNGGVAYATNANPFVVTNADFNNDGLQDVLVSYANSNTVMSLLLNTGGGNLGTPASIPTGGAGNNFAAVGDFNGDGNKDIAVVNQNAGNVGVLMGLGSGAFQTAVTYAAGTTPSALVVTDMNGDGKPDFVVAAQGASTMYVYLNAGTGTFGSPAIFASGLAPYIPAAADFDGDGRMDIAVGYSSAQATGIFLNLGGGNLMTPATLTTLSRPFHIATDDFNKDGYKDIVVANNGAASVSVFLGQAQGTFQAAATYAVGSAPLFVASGDINSDGKADIVVSNSTGASVSLLFGTGSGTFQTAVNYGTGATPTGLSVADIDLDGYPDVIVVAKTNNVVNILYGSATGTLTLGTTLSTSTNPSGPSIGDFNNDGYPDIAVDSEANNLFSVFLGSGNGNFQTPVTYATQQYPSMPGLGDFNGDGILDIAIANFNSNTLGIYLGTGAGTFGSPTFLPTGIGPASWGLTVTDLNGDSYQDIVVATQTDRSVSVFLGSGTGAFAASVNYTAGASPYSTAIADFDLDGRVDIAVCNYNGNNISLLYNTACH